MPEAGGIKKYVQLLLDRGVAVKTERELQDALKNGTDPAKAKRNIQEVERSAEGLNGTFKKLGVAIAGAFAVRQVFEFGKAMFELGNSVGETGDKFRIVFGEAQAGVQAFLDDWGRLAGLSRREGQELIATMGGIAQGMGMSRVESAKFSEQVLRLAGDFQSFNDVGIDQTFGAIKSALVGQWEPLDRLGVVLRQADVNMRALTDTGKRLESELTQQDKAVAALALIYERAGVQVGNLEETQDSTANQTRALTADFQTLREEIAMELAPAFGRLVQTLIDNREELREFASAGVTVASVAGQGLWIVLNALVSLMVGPVMAGLTLVTGGFSLMAGAAAEAKSMVAGLYRALGKDEAADALEARANELRATAARSRALASGFAQGASDAWTVQGFTGGVFGGTKTTPTATPAGPTTDPAAVAAAARAKMDAARAAREAQERAEKEAKAAAKRQATEAKRAADKARRDAEKAEKDRIRELERAAAYQLRHFATPAMGAGPGALQGAKDFGLPTPTERDVSAWEEFFWTVQDGAEQTGNVMADTFSRSFDLFFSNLNDLNQAFGDFFSNIAAGALAAMGAEARGRAQMSFADAVTEGAKALGALASGNVAAAGTHAAAAGKYMAAGAAWSAIAGGMGAGARGVGGGVGGGRISGGGYDRNPGGRYASQTEAHNITYVYVDPFDSSNPVQTRQIGKALDLHVQLSGKPDWAR